MRLDDAGGAIQIAAEGSAFVGVRFAVQFRTHDQTEPARPGRCQLRQQARSQLIDGVGCRAVKEPICLLAAGQAQLLVMLALRQDELVAFAPVLAPSGSPFLGAPISRRQAFR